MGDSHAGTDRRKRSEVSRVFDHANTQPGVFEGFHDSVARVVRASIHDEDGLQLAWHLRVDVLDRVNELWYRARVPVDRHDDRVEVGGQAHTSKQASSTASTSASSSCGLIGRETSRSAIRLATPRSSTTGPRPWAAG